MCARAQTRSRVPPEVVTVTCEMRENPSSCGVLQSHISVPTGMLRPANQESLTSAICCARVPKEGLEDGVLRHFRLAWVARYMLGGRGCCRLGDHMSASSGERLVCVPQRPPFPSLCDVHAWHPQRIGQRAWRRAEASSRRLGSCGTIIADAAGWQRSTGFWRCVGCECLEVVDGESGASRFLAAACRAVGLARRSAPDVGFENMARYLIELSKHVSDTSQDKACAGRARPVRRGAGVIAGKRRIGWPARARPGMTCEVADM